MLSQVSASHFLGMAPALLTAEHQGTHGGISPGCGGPGALPGRMESPHPPSPPGSSLLQLPDPSVPAGGFCCMQEICCSGGPRDEAAAMQQITWCFTKIGMLRAFFWLSVKKRTKQKRPKLFEAQAVAQGREGCMNQGQRGSCQASSRFDPIRAAH